MGLSERGKLYTACHFTFSCVEFCLSAVACMYSVTAIDACCRIVVHLCPASCCSWIIRVKMGDRWCVHTYIGGARVHSPEEVMYLVYCTSNVVAAWMEGFICTGGHMLSGCYFRYSKMEGGSFGK